MRKEDLSDFIFKRISLQLGFSRLEHVNFLVDDLEKVGISEFPQFNSLAEMVEQTNLHHSVAEKLTYKHIKLNQVGRGEAWCLLTIPTATKASKKSKCDIIIEPSRIEFKEQVSGDIRFLNNNSTIETITELRKNLYIIDRGFRFYYQTHPLAEDWFAANVMDKPNEFSEGKLKRLESILVKLRSGIDSFQFDKWMHDAIKFEDFTVDKFSHTMKSGVLASYDYIVIVDNDKYYLVNSTNCEDFRFTRITVGQPKFVLTIKETPVDSPQNDATSSDTCSISEHLG